MSVVRPGGTRVAYWIGYQPVSPAGCWIGAGESVARRRSVGSEASRAGVLLRINDSLVDIDGGVNEAGGNGGRLLVARVSAGSGGASSLSVRSTGRASNASQRLGLEVTGLVLGRLEVSLRVEKDPPRLSRAW